LKGIGVSGGVGIGKVLLLLKDDLSVPKRKITHSEISREIYRLEEALIETRREISDLQKKISQEIGFDHGRIFEAHFLVLEDRVLIEDVIKQIKNKKVNVEYAFSQSVKRYVDTLLKLNDEYLRERVVDIEDISRRVLRAMLKKKTLNLSELNEKVVVVAHDLAPSQTASLPKENILGFVTDIGGRTSHTAIIARSLRIPAVVGLETATENVKSGSKIVIDGSAGTVIINPTEKTLKEYQKKSSLYTKEVKAIHLPKTLKARTLDGRKIVVSANIELPEEIPLIKEYRAEGIGLYRTEYMFLGRRDLPSEEEQYKAYANVAKKVKPYSVVIRTIDIGGDKFLSQPEVPKEMSPFLGWRAIRFCLARPDIFKLQLRAILRASAEKNVKVMFPMISGVEELKEAKNLLQVCKKELKKEGFDFDKEISVGTMIEVPSAALTADILAKESDFFSIGTNDLIQYSLAVDRTNEKVAYLYEPGHPAVLSLIKQVIDVAHKNNIWVGMCGEMSGETLFAFLLLGLGLDSFSMSPPLVPKIKELISSVEFEKVRKMSLKAMELSTSKEVEAYLQKELRQVLSDEVYRMLTR
ncbi:MAG: phosphoenolpyruvate--protein phosphotransferase, partial [Candidatus Omnitrophica bacterium]|nr:phosphoenolpyruvate--protein phosphotransferase [Candidatus Omnitrophota bacterium]MBD3269790.1 phosphoenolpyruvate--protein phosphotransferase [Candidatus Omnitrophota bacterium]